MPYPLPLMVWSGIQTLSIYLFLHLPNNFLWKRQFLLPSLLRRYIHCACCFPFPDLLHFCICDMAFGVFFTHQAFLDSSMSSGRRDYTHILDRRTGGQDLVSLYLLPFFFYLRLALKNGTAILAVWQNIWMLACDAFNLLLDMTDMACLW